MTIGTDEHAWSALWLIAPESHISRYIREHEQGGSFISDAMVYLGRLLRNWSVNLKLDVSHLLFLGPFPSLSLSQADENRFDLLQSARLI